LPKRQNLFEDQKREVPDAFEQALKNFKQRNGVNFFEALKETEGSQRIIARNMAKETFRIRIQLIYNPQVVYLDRF
jgi:hypothetical protein